MKNIFQSIRKPKPQTFITVVSGLPRSGTSMMMKMLDAGGIPPMTDNIRTPDIENPKGYYEFERVKKLPEGDKTWIKDAQGKSVKIISALLEHLPSDSTYKIIFMRRKMEEILASQKQMLIRSGKPTDKVSDEKLAEMYQKHIGKVETWLSQQSNMTVLYVEYNAMLKDPTPYIQSLNKFLGGNLDIQKMIEVVDPELYRQRKT
jgi:hypothetical protein